MTVSPLRSCLSLLLLATVLAPADGSAQSGLLGRVKRRVEDNVARRAERVVDCVMGDQACVDKAKAAGQTVKIDSTKSASGAPTVAEPTTGPGGEGGAGTAAVWANFDFVPGTKTIFYDDFRGDPVGNFPQRYEFVNGNIELVTYRERTWLRFASTGQMYVPLPADLPERFTIEMDYWGTNGECWVYPNGSLTGSYKFEFGAGATAGASTPNGSAENAHDAEQRSLIHQWRVMVDRTYAKVYVNATRAANVPNFAEAHGNKIGFYCDAGMSLGPIRIAEGSRTLYESLSTTGRVATQGIYFDTGSDRIRPESTPTLKEIASMLSEHAALRLRIEGHTDDVGEAAANLDLSRRRAEAVKAYLTGTLKVAPARLEATGLGSSKPVQANTTAEGRQTNRRVELVKLP